MPGFTRAHLKLLSELPKEALVTSGYEEYGKEGWFLYFWKEARPQAGFMSRSADVLPFFNELFQVPAEWVATPLDAQRYIVGGGIIDYQPKVADNDRIKTLAYVSTWAAVGDATLLRLLKACLAVGFQKVSTSGSGLGNLTDLDSPLAFARHNLILDRDHSYTVGWRGDGRSLGDLRTAGGFLPKADSDKPSPDPHDKRSYAEKINLREAWNPFSDPLIRAHYYYRRMQQDNCLHTVVSVTLDFVTASTFPKLEDLIGSAMKGVPLKPADTVDNPPAALEKRLCKVRIRGGKPIRRFADRQQLYLVVLFGGFFDTQRNQAGDKEIAEAKGTFPEVAVKKIPANNILGSLSFVRVFHGLTEAEGFTAAYDDKRSMRPTIDACEAFAGSGAIARNLLRELTKQYDALVRLMPLHACWTGTGGRKVDDKPLAIESVQSADGLYLY